MENFIFRDKEGLDINYYKWSPDVDEVKGIIQIAHGMTETALRYDYFAKKLTKEGYIVYAHDHRGHGDTAKSKENLGYVADDEGFYWMVNDIKELNDIIKKENPNKKVVLFGHSMGSFLSQRYFQLYGDKIDGLILSGSNGRPKNITKLGILVAKLEMTIKGRKAKSRLMDKLSFGDFNNNFKPNRSNYDWLCSVEEEVDKYIQDEKCGFICSTSFYYDLIRGLWDIHKEENLNGVPKNKPVYIFSGDKDPVGYFGVGVKNLYETLKRNGVSDIEYKLYENGRHEMLNEKNKDEVILDIIDWIKCKII
ncbi:alpha/beta hydrolase [Clostridium septicum]|uniref:Alpha/beta hydrolase n=1 Tax=Clostridium septicum TaxID=1504 RepID=A0A9N7JMP0_CLOSE|nr:alpha/beta hydrolase [Clostridium septicum]AYE35408.1 alpha/beta hydrolase [Clostridium septicum]MDU1314381.1 lysophospholipase [Clostridium septicum]QAS60796.1 alpha/beta fold hydrolase [Clostridium septicum]UEC19939.1 alpha/beta hydrolase [Clostridium septicum]USS02001.1 lysophospholipase [Clostridium septicum]